MNRKLELAVGMLAVVMLAAGACTSKPKSAPNVPPTAVLLADPLHGAFPHEVDMSGILSSDPDGSIVSYDWDLGDGTEDTQAELSHSYTVEGVVTVSLTVTDDRGATDTDTVDITVGNQSVPTLGCHDGPASVIYVGPFAEYKNAYLAGNNVACGSEPLNLYFTLVTATSETEAFAVCAAGPDPAADSAVNLKDLGWTTMGSDVWSCNNPASDELLVADTCYPVGTASVKYLGPRDSLDNAALYSGTTCSTVVDSTWTYVQHSTQAAAAARCTSIDPVFDKADSLAGIFPDMPDDTYLCGTATP